MKKTLVLLGAVTILAAVLRLYRLGSTPISLEWDEVAIGYDAYSLIKTGRDQFGDLLPVTFRSLDDYKPPIYEYLTVIPVSVFGLTGFAVRLPSALSGIGMVFLLYFFAGILFQNIFLLKNYKNKAALLASFLLAVSPWHIQFSRAAFEVNVAALITVSAVFLFLKGLKNPRYFIYSAGLFGLDLFSYHSARVVAPLLLIFLFVIFNKSLPGKKPVIYFMVIFGVFLLAVLPVLFSQNAQIRFTATNIFRPAARYLDEKDLDKIFLEQRLNDIFKGYEFSGKIFHNRRLVWFDYDTLKKAFNNYLSNYRFEYLFIKGDAPLHHAPGFGLFHMWELPYLAAGIIFLLFKGLNRYSLFLLFWLLIAPLPNAVTREAPHSVRTLLLLPVYQLLGAAGLIYLYNLAKENFWVLFLPVTIITFLFIINHGYYLHQYFIHTDFDVAANWKYGRKQAVNITEKIKINYDRVLVSLSLEMPHVFWLFYSRFPPDRYLVNGGTVSGGYADERNSFDKYQFRNFDYKLLKGQGNLLLVGTPGDFPAGADIFVNIYNPDGSVALQMARN
ncbi:hypothetical protein A3D05_04605 [Candidatus Gottesmanbacteria bacterium RIFCSPHIGHO2_02_FULL_40_24]|uniref:Glycosyltransferase RgtA/B/C/D-like domain-containing protein n=1 Tax=Candidatus Gottesmanbacteria bacterium RIFCSPHIGHO2_01_FULL_40_15 TaxID=1798376 RepID=A0A1F5Z2U7_9BACT|nr:MAG: hypothetical protein A2777_05635 [Candidatus Gottesmanbacteria bacterium RIFCSPHIGHO2_01_FULL_40_15]OGG16151.1 MAG: hypothetical protein A3D05_04605 [Candidatus Gottesmanbacteria bacterium RIFCSPHIGHO2_02_FULL_40_24]OGG25821.1 MAG: hypothetical protein A3E42_05875 [Candidatus Gottesmanbacteria bacterium RIFCSPHIGHO2_12_FULL_40_13]OGG33267.1 MAG: hypothetical protein A3I80_02405 [Candidatus Gottesmanbacteria bacterium RIFCSPLOWO2_02_FULL_40_10]